MFRKILVFVGLFMFLGSSLCFADNNLPWYDKTYELSSSENEYCTLSFSWLPVGPGYNGDIILFCGSQTFEVENKKIGNVYQKDLDREIVFRIWKNLEDSSDGYFELKAIRKGNQLIFLEELFRLNEFVE